MNINISFKHVTQTIFISSMVLLLTGCAEEVEAKNTIIEVDNEISADEIEGIYLDAEALLKKSNDREKDIKILNYHLWKAEDKYVELKENGEFEEFKDIVESEYER